MYLKAIKIKGFKSFLNATTITMPKGMTSIVGPNGSGKSNILDAIRWVLGEQSVKSLRGEKMEDVIFAGTEKKSPIGYCEVTLIIDNEDRQIDIDYTEISIKRKAYRSGESQFFINEKRCRLKDIKELLLDTGIGKEGYSIISQGRIDEIIQSNSFQKRALLEEACGITKYRYKKQEGEKSLEIATDNLNRIIDVFTEIENQIRPLKLQKEKAEKYLSYKEELKLQEINKALSTKSEYEKESFDINEKKKNLYLQISENENTKNKIIKNIDDTQLKLEELSKNQKTYYDKKQDITKKISDSTMSISLKKEEINSLEKNNVLLDEQLSQTDEEMKSSLEKINNLNRKLQESQNNYSIKKDLLKQKQTQKDRVFNVVQNLQIDIRNDEQKIRNIENDISKLEAKMEFVQKNIEQFEIQKTQYVEKEKNYLEIIEKNNSFLQDKKNQIDEINTKINKISEKIIENNKKTEQYQEESNKIVSKINEDTISLKDKIAKTDMLENLENDMQGFSKGIKVILQNKSLDGIQNIVANVIKVKQGYEKAIENLLTGRLENIIIEKSYQTKKAIDFLKEKKLGRLTFLPMDVIKPAYLNYNDIGVKAIDVVEYDKKYENIVSNLLGKLVIVDDMDSALKISKKYNHSIRLSTKDGEIFNVGGSITGGSSTYSKDIFTRRSQIIQNKKDIEILNQGIKKLQEDMKIISKNFKELKNQNINYLSEQSIYTKNLQILQNEHTKLLSKIENTISMKNELVEEKIMIDEANEKSKKTYNEDKNTMHKLQTLKDSLNEKQDKNKVVLKENSENLEQINKTITDIELEYKLIKQEISSTNTTIKDIQNMLDNSDNKIKLSKEKIQSNKNHILTCNKIIKEQEHKIESLQNDLENTKNQIDLCDKDIKNNSDILKENIKYKEDIEKILNKLNTDMLKLENEYSKISYKIQMLSQNLYDSYNIDINEASAYKDDNIVISETTIKKLKQEILNLGSVNIAAIEEYKKVEQRYTLYKTQKEDLEQSIEKIKKVIKDLEKTMISDFKQNFDIIKNHFNDIFKILFSGGFANIKLEDENDVLNSNININVQPPGKKLRGLSMLSGGEKALVAIALLFAIIAKKPVPFCILDEIDAPLDDANITRYVTYLSTITDITQFITITHRRITMESSDYIYGVTMQEKGISDIISLKLEDAKHYIEE